MIDRFKGDSGKKALIEALVRQDIVGGDQNVAKRLAATGQLVPFAAGATLIEQDGKDDHAYFIISGKTDVFVNHHPVAEREGGTVVGEMAAVDPTELRSATVKASTDVLALRVSAADFLAAGEESPKFWRKVAQLAMTRLRERAKFHLPANATPILFVGSSIETLPWAKEIQACMKHNDLIVRPWTSDVFGASSTPIEDLLTQLGEADFALFVFGPDDKIESRSQREMAPRDNVIFEMGLFIGRLGRDRVFMVKDQDVDLKIPSDLSGVMPITYKCKPGCNPSDVIGPVCTQLEKIISARGVVRHRMKHP